MNSISTGLCAAAALALTATLGAQTPTTTTASQTTTAGKGHDVTVTGCLSKASGGFMLTDSHVDTAAASTTTASGSTTAGGTSTTTATGTSGTSPAASAPAMSWMLSGDSDLEKHVGHKIQVTGRTSWDGSMDHGRTSTTTASGAGTTAAPPAATTATTPADGPHLDVKSIKMVSSSCS
jgi:hypothetical protein